MEEQMETTPLGRPEEILEVAAIVDRAAVEMADCLRKGLPHLDRDALIEWCRAEFSCAAEDLATLMHSKFGAPK